jgi:hypothetical protein
MSENKLEKKGVFVLFFLTDEGVEFNMGYVDGKGHVRPQN